MRIAALGNAAALHTRRWARALAARGATVRLLSRDDDLLAHGAAA